MPCTGCDAAADLFAGAAAFGGSRDYDQSGTIELTPQASAVASGQYGLRVARLMLEQVK